MGIDVGDVGVVISGDCRGGGGGTREGDELDELMVVCWEEGSERGESSLDRRYLTPNKHIPTDTGREP